MHWKCNKNLCDVKEKSRKRKLSENENTAEEKSDAEDDCKLQLTFFMPSSPSLSFVSSRCWTALMACMCLTKFLFTQSSSYAR